MKSFHAPTEREAGFPADGIDLEFYHFLCHKSPRLGSLHFDQCQHFCLYALLKCCTLVVWSKVFFPWKNLKVQFPLTYMRVHLVTMLILKLKLEWVWINRFYGSKRCDVSPQHTELVWYTVYTYAGNNFWWPRSNQKVHRLHWFIYSSCCTFILPCHPVYEVQRQNGGVIVFLLLSWQWR